MGQALYRKYRPQALSGVIGQEHITETLARALKAGRVSHAYLLTGPKGVGKTSIARILAHEINQLPYQEKTHLDIIEIDAASNRRIDDIRDLRDKIHITPISAKYKVYIIDEAHMLTGESFNALLKTLEEPPAHVVFILATTEAHKLPATIISRTQRFTFRPVTKEKVAMHLRTIAELEAIDISDDALGAIADYGEGSFRDSISLLDQLTHISSGPITEEAVRQSLGLVPRERISKLVQAIIANDRPGISTMLGELAAQGAAVGALVRQLSQALLSEATHTPELYRLIDALLEAPRAYNPHLKLLSAIMVHTLEHTLKPPKDKEPRTPPKLAMPQSETPKNKPDSKLQPQTPTTPLQSMSPTDWGKILEATKLASPPLYAVIKQAQPIVDDGGQLVLKFKFQLHSKKLHEAKAKAQLTTLIQSVIGTAPIITTAVDKLAAPLTVAADPAIADVAAIMGGGEVIPNAEAI